MDRPYVFIQLCRKWTFGGFFLTLWITLLWRFMYKFLCWHIFLFLLDVYLGVRILGHMRNLCLIFWETARLFPKAAASFYVPTSMGIPISKSLTAMILRINSPQKLWTVTFQTSPPIHQQTFWKGLSLGCPSRGKILHWGGCPILHKGPLAESKLRHRDFPGGPVVKSSPSYARGAGSIPGRGAKFPHASGPKNQNIKQKQYCNKFNKDFKNGPHKKKSLKNK